MQTALVLSGGGAKGAFQAGALRELSARGYRFDSVAGVSVGALNGVMLASGQVERMVDIWRTIRPEQVYRKRSLPFLALQYLAHKIGIASPPQSIYSNEPLFNLLRRELDTIALKIPLTIGRVNLESGNYLRHIEPDNPDFARQVLASTAIPVVWEPVCIEGARYVDGGIRNTTPLKDAVQTDPDRIVIVTNGPIGIFGRREELKDIFDIAERSLDILLDEIFQEDLKRFLQINRLVQQAGSHGVSLHAESGRLLKYYEVMIVAPEKPLGSALNFERHRLDHLLQRGREAAIKLINDLDR